MKAGLLSIAALAANAAALALPANVKREIVTDFFTQIEYVTATAPAAVVYVDQNGSPISAPTNAVQHGNWHGGSGGWHGHSSAAAPAPAVTTVAPVVPAPVIPAVSTPEAPAPVFSTPEVPAAPAPSTPATGSSGSVSGLGISYAPYKLGACGSSACAGDCKSASEVATDLAALKEYSSIRTYGTDCNQIANVLAALAPGQKAFFGIYNIDDIVSEVSSLKSQVGNNWDRIDTISIGNEAVANGKSPAAVIAAVTAARALLAGSFSGSIVTVDTSGAIIANPSLCAASDYVAANCHAFFNANIDAAQAGSYVQSQVTALKQACGDKRVVITESGWPTAGQSNGAAVPSWDNMVTATKSLKSSFSSDLILFSAYNDAWKKNWDGSFDAEQYWGILGNSQFS